MSHKRVGFTIVELIIVITIIGILAGIVIIGYGAWRKQTTVNVVKSDLTAAAAAMEDARNFNAGGYPQAVPSTVQPSDTVQLSGGGRAAGVTFCISGTSTTDASIKLYVSDRQKTPVEGDCTTTVTQVASSLNRADGLAVADDGTIYVPIDTPDYTVRKITPSGTVSLYAGVPGTQGSVNGPAATATFRDPRGTAVGPDGSVYVADINGNAIRKISPDLTVSTLSTTGIDVTDVAMGIDGKTLYATTGDNNRSKVYSIDGTTGAVTLIAGNETAASTDGVGATASFWATRSITQVSDGTLFVCDLGSGLVRKIATDTTVTTYAGQGVAYPGGATPAIPGACGAVAAGPHGSLYVTAGSNKLYMIDKNGAAGVVATLSGIGSGLATNSSGNVWMSSGNNNGSVYQITLR